MNIKDIIYLDETLLNSSLAQYEKGLVKGLSSESGTDTTNTINKTSETTGGLDGLFGLGVIGTHSTSDLLENSATESQKEIINVIVHDHAIDILISYIDKSSMLKKDIITSIEGDFVLVESDFHIYDFEYLESLMSTDSLELFHTLNIPDELNSKRIEILQGRNTSELKGAEKAQLQKIDKEITQHKMESQRSTAIFNQIHLLGKFGKNIFPSSLVVSINNAIAISANDKFRMNRSQLAMLNDSKKKIKILGKIIGIKTEFNSDGFVDEFASRDLGKIPTFMSDIVLGSFNIQNKNDKLIRPIALYFE